MTEMTAGVAMVSPDQARGPLGSSCNPLICQSLEAEIFPGGGQLLPGIQARVMKADGTLAEYGEPWELVIKGPSMAMEYLDNPEAYVDVQALIICSDNWMSEQMKPFVMGT